MAKAEYVLGEGIYVGDVYVSGYSKLAWEAPHNSPQELILDDLSLFASANINPYFNPFIEAEVTTAQLWKEGDGTGFRGARVVLERLYNDVHINDQVNIRIGKALAPLGEWNRIHAAPLVWTTNRPLTTRYSFAESYSGVGLQYTQHDNDTYQVYFQPGSEWAPKPLKSYRPRYYENVAGFTLDHYIGLNGKLGLGVQHADVKGTGDSQWVFSLDGQWKTGNIDLEFQGTYTDVDFNLQPDKSSKEWGAYTQAVWHWNDRWHTIIRPEYFNNRYDQSQGSMLYGMVYQPQPGISLKLEYMDTQQRVSSFGFEQGWYGSLAVLF